MTDKEFALQWLNQILPMGRNVRSMLGQDVRSLAALLARIRLDEAKWWCHVVNNNEPYKWVAIGDERLRTLEQAAGGSAAAGSEK